MKKLFLCVLALSVCVSAADGLEERVGGLQAQVDRVLSKAGIHFSGEFRSQFLNSEVSGSAVDGQPGKTSESAEYTSVDFDVVARPNTALSARAVFRLHQDWRNFFSDVANPITTRWLSIDGSVGDGILKYNAGDYKKKLTPLTLWSPDLELLYEPAIFASARELAMSEAFLGDNNRLLQGVNLSFKAELYPLLNEVEADVFGARLATRGTIESAVIPPGVGFNAGTDIGYNVSVFDKYLVGFNVGTQVIEGAGLAGSIVTIFDYLESSRLDSNAARLASQSTNVFSGRLNADNRAFMSDELVRFGINAEVAYSLDKDYYGTAEDLKDSVISGMALNASLFARFALGEEDNVNLTAGFINNEKDFRNDAAQSPSFIQRTIMNNEQALSGLGMMNPFDAMYRSVFKYAPSQYFGGTKPYGKYAYNNAILTREQIAGLNGHSQVYYPNVFQEALPGGLASADRTGPFLNLKASLLDKAITVGAKAAILTAVDDKVLEWEAWGEDDEGNPILLGSPRELLSPEYQEIAVGASVDIAKFVPIGPSLVIGGSIAMYDSKTGGLVLDGSTPRGMFTTENANTLISGVLNYNFVERFSLLFGYQRLESNVKNVFNNDESTAKENDYVFDNLAVGFGYKVADGGNLIVKLSMLSGKNDQGGIDYKAMQPEVYLTVKF